jgi:hypothetical protein
MFTDKFRLNQPKVVFERFDDELVLVDFETGNYFSFDQTAADLLNFLDQGHSPAAIAAAYARAGGSATEIDAGIRTFVERLIAEGILVKRDGPSPALADLAAPRSFTAPTLQKFTDMQELLLLDPVHDVDDMGWPTQPPLPPADDPR